VSVTTLFYNNDNVVLYQLNHEAHQMSVCTCHLMARIAKPITLQVDTK